MSERFDVLVAGGGPAGRALATACAERGLTVAAVAPDHEAGWPNTYGTWVDELEPLGVADALAASWPATVVRTGTSHHRLARRYGLIDNGALAGRLRERFALAGGREVTGAVATAEAGRAELESGSALQATVVVDATGHRPSVLRWPGSPTGFQTAYGVVATCSSPPGDAGAMTLMDTRSDPLGAVGEPTFLYAMDLGADRWFVQETSLARREPMAFDVLEARLRRRMASMGVSLSDETAVERCVFPLGTPLPEPQAVLGYGAAAGMVHPATGYQVGTALARAPEVADVLASAVDAPDGEHPSFRAWAVLWSPDRRRQRALHDLGLKCLLRFDARQFERFFGAFFSLPEGQWRAYLSGASSVAETRQAMTAVFRRAGGVRHVLAAVTVAQSLPNGAGWRHTTAGDASAN